VEPLRFAATAAADLWRQTAAVCRHCASIALLSCTAARVPPLLQIIEYAREAGVPAFVQPGDITSGNRRLNLAFVAQIFNTNHGLQAEADELKRVEEAFDAAGLEEADAAEDAREERVFTTWLNALGLEDSAAAAASGAGAAAAGAGAGGDGKGAAAPKQVRNLIEDLNDGILLLEAMAKLVPGSVEEKKVNKERLNRFKKIENCNYAVTVAREKLGLSLPGTGGTDVAGGNKKLVLGIMWQLMRLQTVQMLQAVGGGAVPKDADIIAWANAQVAGVGKEGSIAITSFKDEQLASGCVACSLACPHVSSCAHAAVSHAPVCIPAQINRPYHSPSPFSGPLQRVLAGPAGRGREARH